MARCDRNADSAAPTDEVAIVTAIVMAIVTVTVTAIAGRNIDRVAIVRSRADGDEMPMW